MTACPFLADKSMPSCFGRAYRYFRNEAGTRLPGRNVCLAHVLYTVTRRTGFRSLKHVKNNRYDRRVVPSVASHQPDIASPLMSTVLSKQGIGADGAVSYGAESRQQEMRYIGDTWALAVPQKDCKACSQARRVRGGWFDPRHQVQYLRAQKSCFYRCADCLQVLSNSRSTARMILRSKAYGT